MDVMDESEVRVEVTAKKLMLIHVRNQLTRTLSGSVRAAERVRLEREAGGAPAEQHASGVFRSCGSQWWIGSLEKANRRSSHSAIANHRRAVKTDLLSITQLDSQNATRKLRAISG